MKEKLIIKNFGPLKSVDLDLGKITVLIGEQATGKSTVAKVLSICRYFSYIVDDSELLTNYTSRFSNTALFRWGLTGFERDDSYIHYINPDYQVEIKNYESFDYDYSDLNEEPTKIPAPLIFKPTLKPISDRFKKLFQEYQKLKPKPKMKFGIQSDWRIPYSFLISDVKNVMSNPFYFPAERGLQSIFSIGKRGLENLNDKLYEQLADINSLASNFKKETQIKPLDIHYKFENGQGKFKGKKDNAYFNLRQGANGYQSAIPIALAVKYYNEIENRKKTFIIEEPEQNLFPEAQKKLMEFMVESVNKFDNQFILPTHSPYILVSLENLMYAYKLGNAKSGKLKEKVSNIVNEKYWINPEDINAYYLNNGEAEDVMIREEYLIDKNHLDEISDVLGKTFDELIEIEIELEKDQ